MSWLGSLVRAMSPYRLGRIDRRTESHQPAARSGDSALAEALPLMLRRVRDGQRNVAQMRRLVASLVDLIVGSGVQTFAWPFSAAEQLELLAEEIEGLEQGSLGPRLRYALESDELFLRWWNDPQQVDFAGKFSGPDLQRIVLSESIQSGSGLLLRVIPNDGRRRIVPLAYQVIEREQLDTGRDRGEDGAGTRIVGGVEIDQHGRRLAYWVLGRHPHDEDWSPNKSVRIPAERMIDLSLFSRPSSSSGEPWLAAVAQATLDRDSFLDSEIKSAAMAAAFCLVHQQGEGAGSLSLDDGTGETEDQWGNEEVRLGNSPMAVRVGPGEDVKVIESTRPNPSAEPFMRLLDRDTAAGAGVSYYSLTGDYAATSYTSTRAAKLDEELHIAPLRRWMASILVLPIRRDFNRLAAASGLLSSVTPAEFLAREETYQSFEAFGSGRDLLDPTKETSAAIDRLRNGLTTQQEECAVRGKHWLRVLLQQAIESKVAGMLGRKLDYTNTAAANATTTEGAANAVETE